MAAPIARAEELPPAPGVEAAGQKEAGDNLGQGGQNIDTMGVDGLELGPEIVSQSVSATPIEAPTITEANAGTKKLKAIRSDVAQLEKSGFNKAS